jgi:hypothetical protein
MTASKRDRDGVRLHAQAAGYGETGNSNLGGNHRYIIIIVTAQKVARTNAFPGGARMRRPLRRLLREWSVRGLHFEIMPAWCCLSRGYWKGVIAIIVRALLIQPLCRVGALSRETVMGKLGLIALGEI